jgi:tetratricopeptide (TPR) repeat protein
MVDADSEGDVFSVADSLAGMIRNYFEIKKLIEEYDYRADTESALTSSPESFRYYMHAWDALQILDYPSTFAWLMKSIEIDSGFVNAYIFLSFASVASGQSNEAKKWCAKAYIKRNELSVLEKLYVDHLHAYLFETPHEEITLCQQILEMDEMNSVYWHMLGDAYYKLNQYKDAALNWEKVISNHEQWGTVFPVPHFYLWLGDAYHHLGNHQREKEVYELGLAVAPNFTYYTLRQGACALSQGDTINAKKYITEIRSLAADSKWTEAYTLSRIGYIYYYADSTERTIEYYSKALELDPGNADRLHSLAWVLIDNDIDIAYGMELVRKALESEPQNSYFLDTRGWGFFKQGKYKEALEFLKSSWELRALYDHDIFLHIQEVEQALANQNS